MPLLWRCGAQRNLTLYNELFNAPGRAILIENCHQGQNFTDGGDPERTAPLLLCRSVGPDGSVVIGTAEPGNDLMLSELLLWECPDEV